MKALVVYDSVYGNTEKIARAIADALAGKGEARLVRAGTVGVDDIGGVDLLVVGAPTQGGRPTPIVQAFLKGIPPGRLASVRAAAFDTRIVKGGAGTVAKLFGYAARRIESELIRCGARQIVTQGFAVKGRGGPLEDGEEARAREWATSLAG
jgi:flavodoxin